MIWSLNMDWYYLFDYYFFQPYLVIEVGCKIDKANQEIANLTIALDNQPNGNGGKYQWTLIKILVRLKDYKSDIVSGSY